MSITKTSMPDRMQEPSLQIAPLYSQLRSALKSRIETGEWSAGAYLPSEIDLAKRFGVSVGTTRKALEALEAEGLIVRRQGRGTIVASRSDDGFTSWKPFRVRHEGKDAHEEGTVETLAVTSVPMPPADAAGSEGEEALCVLQRLSVSGRPAFVTRYELVRSRIGRKTDHMFATHAAQSELDAISRSLVVGDTMFEVRSDASEARSLIGVDNGSKLLHCWTRLSTRDGTYAGRIDRWYVIKGFELIMNDI